LSTTALSSQRMPPLRDDPTFNKCIQPYGNRLGTSQWLGHTSQWLGHLLKDVEIVCGTCLSLVSFFTIYIVQNILLCSFVPWISLLASFLFQQSKSVPLAKMSFEAHWPMNNNNDNWSYHHSFNGPFPAQPGLAGNVTPFWILLELRTMELVVTAGAIRCAKPPTNFLHSRCPSCHPNKIEAARAKCNISRTCSPLGSREVFHPCL